MLQKETQSIVQSAVMYTLQKETQSIVQSAVMLQKEI